MLYKTCTACKRRKPLDNFASRPDNRSKGTPQGKRKSWCKVCCELKRKERMIKKPKLLEKRRTRQRKYAHEHKEERTTYRKEYLQSSPFGWLSGKFNQIKTSRRNRHYRPAKIVKIDRDYLMRLWKRQKGLCALTGVSMTTKFHDPFSASPDRIDSSKGYIPRNVQLVSKSAQFAKGNLSMAEFKRWLNAIKQFR